MLRRRVIMGKGSPISGKTPAQIAGDIDALEYIIRSDTLSKKWEPLLQGYADAIIATLSEKYPKGTSGCNEENLETEYYNEVSYWNAWVVMFPLDTWSQDWNTNYSSKYHVKSMLTGKRISYKTGVAFRGLRYEGDKMYNTRKLEYHHFCIDK